MTKPDRSETPDVEISASAKATELRFDERPDVTVHRVTQPRGESVSASDRTNLPDEVTTNVSYRDIRIDFRVAAELADPDDEPHKL
ncbi:hypothetical protein [Nonomuraea aridisoli]|uniref:Uncharacterized protein n=1 Tax=Nonomuraea aridisoli TaxID=2070368 RepID=A0A2W2E4W7_9ACTN|nr:hypothetical protein [Nonomuraea aridisoli]PZG07088.1 hypothetical protein C1J01_41505 [Nonomuraea aridisoli]